MASEARFHNIVVSRRELVDALAERAATEPVAQVQEEGFRALAKLLEAVFHFEFHERLEQMKACYAPFNPDRELPPKHVDKPVNESDSAGEASKSALSKASSADDSSADDSSADDSSADDTDVAARPDSAHPADDGSETGPTASSTPDGATETAAERLTAELEAVLERGNYQALTKADIDYAFRERSLFPIDVVTDFDSFAQFVVYARGEQLCDGEVPKWFGLRKKTVSVPTFDRVCLYIRFKRAAELDPKRRMDLLYEPGSAIIKLFRAIPKADLEMLFPNIRPKMRLVDKLLIGVPAVVGGVPVMTKLAPAFFALAIIFGIESGKVDEASIIAGLTGLVALGVFLFRQWDKFKNRKVLFMKMLSENLYFKNLGNNEGVLTRLIDEAEEEESKEALLAYYFLLVQPEQTEEQLAQAIEGWFQQRFGFELCFEVDDALAKLVRLGLAQRGADDQYRVVSLPAALQQLDEHWDALFSYHLGERAGAFDREE